MIGMRNGDVRPNAVPWDRFDLVQCLTCVRCPNRWAQQAREFARVGLHDVLPVVNMGGAWARFGMAALRHWRGQRRRACANDLRTFDCMIGHLRMIRTALAFGAERPLFLEDDVRFLRDVSEIRAIVDALPADCDVALFDINNSHFNPPDHLRTGRLVGASGKWRSAARPRSGGCYTMTRRAMETVAARLEAVVNGSGNAIANDTWDDKAYAHLRICYAWPPAAIQSGIDGDYRADVARARFGGEYVQFGIDAHLYNLGE